MRLYHLLAPVSLCALLAACQTMTPEERRAADETTCAGYGFRRGSEAMGRCMLDLELDRRAESRAAHIRASNSFMWHPMVVERRVIVERK